jgi:hypothetical protein
MQTSLNTATSAIRELLQKVPARDVSGASIKLYRRTFGRMSRETVIDPLRPGDARDTYNVRRAALHWGTRWFFERLTVKLETSWSAGDAKACLRWIGIAGNAVDRLGPAIDRDPPLWDGKPDFLKPSRWQTENKNKIARGSKSKKHTLEDLAPGWIERFWPFVPVSHKYRDAIAVISVSPARPGEVVPGDRPSGFSAGVAVALDKNGFLVLATKPLKTHDGKYGMDECALRLDVAKEGAVAKYLAQRCREEGGFFIVKIKSAQALSKALTRIGARAFPKGPDITAYVFRHQRMADVKAAFGAGRKTALAAGHCNDGSQGRYGDARFGRKGGLIGAYGTLTPRLVEDFGTDKDADAEQSPPAPA